MWPANYTGPDYYCLNPATSPSFSLSSRSESATDSPRQSPGLARRVLAFAGQAAWALASATILPSSAQAVNGPGTCANGEPRGFWFAIVATYTNPGFVQGLFGAFSVPVTEVAVVRTK